MSLPYPSVDSNGGLPTNRTVGPLSAHGQPPLRKGTVKAVGVEGTGQNTDAIHNPRAWGYEVSAVCREHAAGAPGRHIAPARQLLEDRPLLKGVAHVEAARRDEDRIGRCRPNPLPAHLNAVLAGPTDQLPAASDLDHLRDPVPLAHEGIEPPYVEGPHRLDVGQCPPHSFKLLLHELAKPGRLHFRAGIPSEYLDTFEDPSQAGGRYGQHGSRAE